MRERADDGPALLFEGVSRSFHAGGRVIRALDTVSASVERGALTGLLGPDGAGKTTLLRLAAGLLKPDRGRISVLGIDAVKEPARVQEQISYMPQNFGLYEDLSVRENLDLYADLKGLTAAERQARFGELLNMTGLGSFTGRLAGRLSGGMKQKLGLACALLRTPALLFLDEPTVGVDPLSRRELWQLIDHLTGAQGVSVLFSTAYLDEAERCDAVLLLHEGRLLALGDPKSFAARMDGRSFLASGAGETRRRAVEKLSRLAGVIDARLEGAHIRLVTREKRAPPLPPELAGTELFRTKPRFEDSFVALLRAASPEGGPTPAFSAGAPRAAARGAEGIVVRHVSRLFGSFRAVDAVSFSVRRGEIFGLLGANGAGKTTMFRMLCGLIPANSGELRVAGYDLRRAAADARAQIGYMAQKFSLYGDLSVRENLRFFASAYRLFGARRRERMAWALESFDLAPLAETAAKDLSLGHKRRLQLASALMHEPQILFLDEPTSGVDPLARRAFWRQIGALAEEGVTILVTTHFMEEAEYCDRLVIMAEGRILAEGAPATLKARVESPENPEPTMEEAFVGLLEAAAREARAA